jgi:SAM-dependent methyltransferase
MHKKSSHIPFGSSPDGFIPAMAIANFLRDKTKILIIGDFTKRDYNVLTALNKDVSVLDIVPINGIKQFYLQSITEKTPFDNQSFDGIVIAEVLEHLFEDHLALNEINRILKNDGTLVVTVPYLSNVQDEPEYHVRVHSKKTITRLLNYTGFSIIEHFYRGFMTRMAQKNMFTKWIVFGSQKICKFVFGAEKGAELFRAACFKIEKTLGSARCFLPLQRYCESFGGIMKAVKSQKTDFMQIQKESFTPEGINKE